MSRTLMAADWTIRSVLDWTSGDFNKRSFASARLDAELLVAHALEVNRVDLYLDLNRPLSAQELAAVRELVVRRREHEPVAYILGYRDFFGRRFSVAPAVLIPRPDTETLVEHALACLELDAPSRVLDVGTGSGAIAVSIACERPTVTVDALDVSAPALAIAQKNAESHSVGDRVRFLESDMLEGVPGDAVYDVIVANPPYIDSGAIATLELDVRKYEPTLALDGGPDGLALIRRLLGGAGRCAAPEAHLLFEIGADQAKSVRTAAAEADTWALRDVHRDLAGVERVVHLSRGRGV